MTKLKFLGLWIFSLLSMIVLILCIVPYCIGMIWYWIRLAFLAGMETTERLNNECKKTGND